MENLKEKTSKEIYSFEKEKREIKERDARLINIITNFAKENGMVFSEIENCMEKIKHVYLNYGLIKK
ncbi:hypothetical protein JJB75_09600 [Clostridium perfringens]|uniref:hypothetical protein n=1 Tax=Clostridium perfringens TaxID=1502 RepID=UPI000D7179DA|nr:hypothetical protein [Clostridium perfringens]KAB8119295.1 hypothetical protein FVB38_12425 [Clostridium perfringens]MBO3303534.1 hypothetical protein [Clostridium perfringens]MBO3306988.1 hypothetical protein [Clostridium perfringens]MBO3310232.1 hypothetical protein [Clostridium perfringens]MBO3316393.1 hypothetical protein [Clostridium perfringens]